MKVIELTPCPFCGGKAEISLRDYRDYNNVYVARAYCTDCGAGIKYQYTLPPNAKGRTDIDAKRKIAALWNRRCTHAV